MNTFDEVFDAEERRLNDGLAALVLETQARLIDQSPRDTGRFSSNWNIGENTIDSSTTQNTAPSLYVPTISIHNVYHITNSLDYAQALADGLSPQAPAGWVDLIAAEQLERAPLFFDTI